MSFEFEPKDSEIKNKLDNAKRVLYDVYEWSVEYSPFLVEKGRDVLYRTFDFDDTIKTIDLAFPILSLLFFSVAIFFVLKEREFHNKKNE